MSVMKLLKVILAVGMGMASATAWGQNQMMNTTRDQFNVNGLTVPSSGTIWGVASSDKGEMVGTTYLDTAWARGNLKLYKSIQPVGGQPIDTLSGLAMRYNVYFNEIEILMNTYKDIRAVQGNSVKSFSLNRKGKSTLFMNTRLYEVEKKPSGFFEMLVPGNLALVALPKTIVRKPNYNAAFEVGEKDTKVSMGEEYYVVKGNKAEKVSLSRKAILQLMQDKEAEVNQFLKTNEIDLKKRNDLIRVFELYNKRG